jgi:ParB family transcriptional regulator, chromosome partitioning protein
VSTSRGQNALNLLEAFAHTAPVENIPLERIHDNPRQPRRHREDHRFHMLVESIRAQGVLQPILLNRVGGTLELIAGQRRLAASRHLQLKAIPARIVTLNQHEAARAAITENIAREDLNPFDEAEAIVGLLALELGISDQQVIKEFNRLARLTNREIAILHASNTPDGATIRTFEELFKALGRSQWRSFAKVRLPILNLEPELIDALRSGALELTNALAIHRVKNPHERAALLEQALTEGLSARKIRDLTRVANQESESDLERVRRQLNPTRLAALTEEQRARAEELIRDLNTLLELDPQSENTPP